MSSHGRDSLTDDEIDFMAHLAYALVAVGVRKIHVGPRSRAAFESLLILAENHEGDPDIRFTSAADLSENFLLFVSCALRLADWYDDTMVLRGGAEFATRRLAEHANGDRYLQMAKALVDEYKHLVTIQRAE